MFLQVSTNISGPTVKITQNNVVKVAEGTALVAIGPNSYELELDESNVLPLTDTQLVLLALESVPALGLADGLLVPVLIGLRDAGFYFTTRLHGSGWAGLSSENQARALIQATQTINQLGFVGYQVSSGQLLCFPRTPDACNPAPFWPSQIGIAAAELAFALAFKSNSTVDAVESELTKLRVTSRRFSSVATTYGAVLAPPNLDAGIVSITAWKLLEPYLRDPNVLRIHRAS